MKSTIENVEVGINTELYEFSSGKYIIEFDKTTSIQKIYNLENESVENAP